MDNDCRSSKDHLKIFSENRNLLFSIAYRIVGTYHEVEDVLQEVYLQWQSIPLDAVESPFAMLKTITVRRATDLLRKVSRQREEYVGPWVPSPILSEGAISSDSESCPSRIKERSDSLSIGFMMLLEQLSPAERAVYILRSGFDYSFKEIASDLSLTGDHCRQLYRRAKKHLSTNTKRSRVDSEKHEALLGAFQQAIETENIKEFSKVLAEDVVLYSDGGGKAIAALRPIYGREKVLRLILGLAKKWKRLDPNFELVVVNGSPGLLWQDANRLQTVVSMGMDDGQIKAVYLMRNPDKIGHISRG